MKSKAGPAAKAASLDPSHIFRRLAGRRGLVLAVSGGADSTALMVLMAKWREQPPTLVVCVDHGLRPAAAAEAELVVRNGEQLGLPVRVVKAGEPHVSGNLQDWARRVRYRCLADAALGAGYDAIVTAHHRDDQAETFLLRLARGSGVYGLAAMSETSTAHGVEVVRPLLNVSRETLSAIAAESGLPVVSDPSNEDQRFDRVRMRALMPDLAAHGLTAERLAETAKRLGRAAAALDDSARSFVRKHFAFDRFGVARGRPESIAAVPEEIGLRALALILRAVGGAEYTPRLDSVEALRSAILEAGDEAAVKRTLHGVVIDVRRGECVARREWGRDGLCETTVSAGQSVVWDMRFRVEVPNLPGRLSLAPLGWAERRLKAAGADQATLRTLPGLYQDGTLVALPEGVLAADDGPEFSVLGAECLVSQEFGRPGLH